jgi:hypothetical protein
MAGQGAAASGAEGCDIAGTVSSGGIVHKYKFYAKSQLVKFAPGPAATRRCSCRLLNGVVPCHATISARILEALKPAAAPLVHTSPLHTRDPEVRRRTEVLNIGHEGAGLRQRRSRRERDAKTAENTARKLELDKFDFEVRWINSIFRL